MALGVALNDRVIELGYCDRVCQPLSECVHSYLLAQYKNILLVFLQKMIHYSVSGAYIYVTSCVGFSNVCEDVCLIRSTCLLWHYV